MSAETSIRRNFIANYGGQGWAAIMNIAFIPAYIGYLGIEAYGLIGAFSVVLMCATLLDAGMTPTLNREMARFRAGEVNERFIRDLLRSIEILLLGLTVGMLILDWLLAGRIATSWLGHTRIDMATATIAVEMMVAIAALRIAEGVYRGALLGLNRHVTLNVMTAISVTVRAGGALAAIAWISPDILTLFAWQFVAAVGSLIAFAAVTHRLMPRLTTPPIFRRAVLAEVGHFAGGVFLTTVLALLLTQADKIILVRILPLAQFGYYALAATVAAALYQLVAPIAQTYYPRLTELFARGDDQRLALAYHQAAQVVTVMIAPVAAMLALFAAPSLRAWSGDGSLAAAAAPILSVLAVGTMLHTFMYIPYMLQLAAGWSSFSVRINAVAVAVFIPAILYFVPRYGAMGAASVWLALNTTTMLISAHFLHRRLLSTEKWRWYVFDIALPAGAAFIAAAAGRILAPLPEGRIETVVYLGLITAVVYIAAVGASALGRTVVARILWPKRNLLS